LILGTQFVPGFWIERIPGARHTALLQYLWLHDIGRGASSLAASWNVSEDLAERGGGRSLEARRREQICKEEIPLREQIFSLLSTHRKGNCELRDVLKLP